MYVAQSAEGEAPTCGAPGVAKVLWRGGRSSDDNGDGNTKFGGVGGTQERRGNASEKGNARQRFISGWGASCSETEINAAWVIFSLLCRFVGVETARRDAAISTKGVERDGNIEEVATTEK